MPITQNLVKPIAKFPDRLIKLTYSIHAQKRLRERTTGSLILAPQFVRLTWDNTIERRIKNNRVVEATMVLKYKHNVNMYLPIVINSGVVKTIFFRDVKKNTTKKQFFSKEDDRAKANREVEENIQTQDTESKGSGKEGIRADVGFIQSTVGKITLTQKMLGLWYKYIWRK